MKGNLITRTALLSLAVFTLVTWPAAAQNAPTVYARVNAEVLADHRVQRLDRQPDLRDPDLRDTENAELREALYAAIDSAMAVNNIPALSVGVIMDGQVSMVEGFGPVERGKPAEVDGETLFQLGSQTKMFTGIIINNLVLENKLNLDEPIVTYLLDKLTDGARDRLKDVAVRHLLHHSSGLPYRAPSETRNDGDAMLVPYTERDLIHDLNVMELESQPGTNFNYSNVGYAVAAFLAETVSGKEYSELLEEYVAERYGLANTFIEPNEDQRDRVATPYRKDDRNVQSQPWVMGKLAPAGGVYSNIHDLLNIMAIQAEAYRQFNRNGNTDPLVVTENAGTDGPHYGFGLVKIVDENGTRYGHGGDLDGFASDYVFSPEDGVGLVLLTSSGGRWFGQLSGQLFRKLREASSR